MNTEDSTAVTLSRNKNKYLRSVGFAVAAGFILSFPYILFTFSGGFKDFFDGIRSFLMFCGGIALFYVAWGSLKVQQQLGFLSQAELKSRGYAGKKPVYNADGAPVEWRLLLFGNRGLPWRVTPRWCTFIGGSKGSLAAMLYVGQFVLALAAAFFEVGNTPTGLGVAIVFLSTTLGIGAVLCFLVALVEVV